MLEKGLKHISRTVVQPDNFALTMGSGDLPVLATPGFGSIDGKCGNVGRSG